VQTSKPKPRVCQNFALLGNAFLLGSVAIPWLLRRPRYGQTEGLLPPGASIAEAKQSKQSQNQFKTTKLLWNNPFQGNT
jgi:hypothetical protein